MPEIIDVDDTIEPGPALPPMVGMHGPVYIEREMLERAHKLIDMIPLRRALGEEPNALEMIAIMLLGRNHQALAEPAAAKAPTYLRQTFDIPDGYEAVRDANGRATGELHRIRRIGAEETARANGWRTAQEAYGDGSKGIVKGLGGWAISWERANELDRMARGNKS